jgi:hypothetical protein
MVDVGFKAQRFINGPAQAAARAQTARRRPRWAPRR